MRKYLLYKKLVKEHNHLLMNLAEPPSMQKGTTTDDVQDLMRKVLMGGFNLDAYSFANIKNLYTHLHVIKKALSEYHIEHIMDWTCGAAFFAAVCAFCSLFVMGLQILRHFH